MDLSNSTAKVSKHCHSISNFTIQLLLSEFPRNVLVKLFDMSEIYLSNSALVGECVCLSVQLLNFKSLFHHVFICLFLVHS